MLVIASSHPEGLSYVSTSSLDGEKTLKKKQTSREMCKVVQNGSVNID
jgi:hypothetical protein